MSKYVEVKFTQNGMVTDVWTDKQISSYQNFKEELENQGFITDVSSEFNDDKDILEVNENISDVERLIYEIAKKHDLLNNVEIYTTYKYDIIHTIKEYGLPKIIDNFGQVITLPCEESDTLQSITDAFSEVGINLDDVNVAGRWGGKMTWVVNRQIFTVQWMVGNIFVKGKILINPDEVGFVVKSSGKYICIHNKDVIRYNRQEGMAIIIGTTWHKIKGVKINQIDIPDGAEIEVLLDSSEYSYYA